MKQIQLFSQTVEQPDINMGKKKKNLDTDFTPFKKLTQNGP